VFSLSVCAETVFTKLPFHERAQEIARQGFAIEFWHRPEADLKFLEANPQIKVATFVGSEKGSMVHPDGVKAFLDSVEEGIQIAKRLRCKRLILVTGEIGGTGAAVHAIAEHPITRWVTAYKTLCQVAESGEKHDVSFNLEHLNTKVDHARYPLPHVEDAACLVEEVGSPRLRLLMDIYHAQVEEGNIVDTIRKHVRQIGHIHMADAPGRHEPGTGEINYPAVVRALREAHYNGAIGLEALPQGDDNLAIRRFRELFAE
jgi:hydroxypyruvate isomerase